MARIATNKNLKKILPSLLLVIFLIPISHVSAAGVIPCVNDCDFNKFLQLINNIIDWIVKISFPVAAGVFAWAGFQLMTTAVVDKKAQAKKMIRQVFVGFIIILSAWLIVSTVLDTLLRPEVRSTIDINKK